MPSHPSQVDVRGPRFAAWITTMVLILTLVVSIASPRAAAVILGVQTMIFAVTALRGPRRSPYGFLFAKLAAARLGPARELEPVPPLRFAQLVGLVFAAAGVVGFALGVPLWGVVATSLALFAAFLNAAFGICLGCQLYPLVARLRRAPIT
ncbi:hypothetical protein DSM43518_03362 [Mycobacterium marinum]|uniref:Uncharacterized protein n=1 Tax=Mycobacterium marinum TaxID=1781 RepID=A0A2Z5YIE8_MYCMR|nr:DUF4395 domain-containing protein [Mycobacterium marinum]AXN45651.1 hypothetical protein MM1218R_03718 [Mycobacterium marinum]AXN50917.1 hypothetical protein CCUG20998_03515 [Mycobacterium marinum]RFZ01821.1 hypothetical protein DE4381_05269 [Mycobacterium marinum]RFZ04752.1 hypothetical protein VIMS_05044 [Mycobacterium marinum]RFZ06895.1 hypothetical protein DSM43518_03362 [Mycobacterium marinum]